MFAPATSIAALCPTLSKTHMEKDGPLAAGCNIQDELFDSFDQLLDLADRKGTSYDR